MRMGLSGARTAHCHQLDLRYERCSFALSRAMHASLNLVRDYVDGRYIAKHKLLFPHGLNSLQMTEVRGILPTS